MKVMLQLKIFQQSKLSIYLIGVGVKTVKYSTEDHLTPFFSIIFQFGSLDYNVTWAIALEVFFNGKLSW